MTGTQRAARKRSDIAGILSAGLPGTQGTGERMGLITEHAGATGGYEAVQLPSDPVITAGLAAPMFRRRPARPSRRAVLYLHTLSDSLLPDDLASWYTERGFHFYLASLRTAAPQERPSLAGRHTGRALRASFAGLDLACAHLRRVDGIDALIVCGYGAAAATAALWCDARRDNPPADALILSSPSFGRKQRRDLEIPCPVLVLSASDEPESMAGAGARHRTGLTWRPRREPIRLGAHVTWLRLEEGTGDGAGQAAADRRGFFDEMGRWLGAYMYGKVRDQLL